MKIAFMKKIFIPVLAVIIAVGAAILVYRDLKSQNPPPSFAAAKFLQSKNITADGGIRAVIFSDDAEQVKDASCMEGDYSGRFKIASVEFENDQPARLLDQLDLGEMNVNETALHAHNEFIAYEEYGSCNGNLFTFLRLAPPEYKFQPVFFSDMPENQWIFAARFEDIQWEEKADAPAGFTVRFYDNSIGSYREKRYSFDEKAGSFVLLNNK